MVSRVSMLNMLGANQLKTKHFGEVPLLLQWGLALFVAISVSSATAQTPHGTQGSDLPRGMVRSRTRSMVRSRRVTRRKLTTSRVSPPLIKGNANSAAALSDESGEKSRENTSLAKFSLNAASDRAIAQPPQSGGYSQPGAKPTAELSRIESRSLYPSPGVSGADSFLPDESYFRHETPSEVLSLHDLSAWLGFQGFSGPLDQGTNGNFGLQEGLNFGGPFFRFHNIGYQVGLNLIQSDLSGYQAGTTSSPDARSQVFFSTGLFRRPVGNRGWQVGIVWDYLQDDFFDKFNLSQIRSEVSWVSGSGYDYGIWSAAGTGNDQGLLAGTTVEAAPTDQFAFFCRKQFSDRALGRIWGGFSGNADGIFGAELSLPVSRSWALETDLNYLIPSESAGAVAAVQESWAIGIRLVWRRGLPSQGVPSPFRPLFNVADNAKFMVSSTTLVP